MKNKIFIPNIFQSEALKEINQAILENEKAFLIVMPPGTGKTFLAAQWFRLQLEKNPKARLLFICHNQDILSQANDKEFADCLAEFDIPRGYYNKYEKNIGQVTFGTVQTLRKNLTKLPIDYFDYIIVDEAHHYRAKSFELSIKHFKPKVLLGLTGTPYRMDGKSILNVFGKIIYNAPIISGIKNGLLSKIKYYLVQSNIDFSTIKYNGNGNYETYLNKKIFIKEYDDAVIKEYIDTVKKEHNRHKTICFCASIEHAFRMEKLFNDNGIRAASLTGKHYSATGTKVSISSFRRNKIISNFKNGDYDIIFVRDLFNEGIDIPDADSIMMLRPTESSRIFTQQIGRGLRTSKDKDYLLVLDFARNCYRCNIIYEILNEIDINKKENFIKNKNHKNNGSSEIISQNLGCDVRFNIEEIDIVEISEKHIITKFQNGLTKKKMIDNYFDVKKQLNRIPTLRDMDQYGKFSSEIYIDIFGGWNKFLEIIDEIENNKKSIIIVSDYIPKNPLPDLIFDKSEDTPEKDFESLAGYKYIDSPAKEKIRHNVVEKIQDGDSVLILESPELSALKEIKNQGKNPKKIIIPNHLQFDYLVAALDGYKTNLNIEIINTSVIQYIIDHPEEYFNLIWLDYQGAFSFYKRDLDVIFQKELKDMKLIVTFNSFDPNKKDDGHYFTNVIGYVLKKLSGKNKVFLMEDVSQIYKKIMFSVGFDIKNYY